VRAGAEVLQIRRICCDGAGLLGVGPGLLVGLLARLLISRLLLLLCRRLLRIRGLAASGHEGGPRNGCDDRQFQKCDTSSAPGLLTQITRHGRPFPGLRARASPLSTPTRVSGSICPETPAWSKISRAPPAFTGADDAALPARAARSSRYRKSRSPWAPRPQLRSCPETR